MPKILDVFTRGQTVYFRPQKLVEALYSGSAVVVKSASAHPDLVELVSARREFLGEGNAVEEIQDALS